MIWLITPCDGTVKTAPYKICANIKTKENKYGLFKKTEIFYGKPIKNSDLGFENGGSEEYKAATDLIFNEILRLGGYERNNSEENALED